MEKKQSSIDWLASNLGEHIVWEEKIIDLIEQAKAMHKEEIIKAAVQGFNFDAEGFPLEAGHHYGQLWYKNQFEGGNNE